MKRKRNTYKKLIRTTIGAWIYAHMALFAVSCTEAAYHHRNLEPGTGIVRIRPDQSVYTLPALQYHFYNVDATLPVIVRLGDNKGNFEGALPEGAYRVIATNTDAAANGNVAFNDMNSYETANVSVDNSQLTVESLPDNTQRSTFNCQLSTVNSVVVDNLVVTASGSPIHRPEPALLTKQLELVFALRDNLGSSVTELTGLLPGVYPSLVLHTGRPSDESIDQSLQTAIRFTAAGQDGQRQASVGLFGICNPEYGLVYRNIMQIDMLMDDNSRQTVTLDVTNVFTDIIAWNQGDIPPNLTLYIEIKQTTIGIGGIVTGWSNEGETVVDS
jgi:hypothetical protein